MLEFIIDRYNYWIFIILMMMGLYIVISRGNLVKKIIGLNVFQTSVFIFYISIGKVTGGTAPILLGGYGGGHGDDHGADHGAGHSVADKAYDADHGDGASHAGEHGESLHDGLGVNPVDVGSVAASATDDADKVVNDLHHVNRPANETLSAPADKPGFDTHKDPADHAEAAVGYGADSAHAVTEILYSNPLPHVLILTAIVVGVATTSVGLALAVRIREAYGTIEEDELEADDNIAEFGSETEAAK